MWGLNIRRSVGAALAVLIIAGGGAAAQSPATPAFAHQASDLKPRPGVVYGVLDNGMRYAILQNRQPAGLISVRMRIAAGAAHEGPGQDGLAHMLEHLVFRGTKNFPGDTGIKTHLESQGMRFGPAFNAMTGFDETIYQFDIAAASQPKVAAVMDALRDMMFEADLSQTGMDAERNIVLAEERERDSPDLRSVFAVLKAVYPGHAYSRPPIGKVQVLQTAPVERVRAFYDAYYRPERAILVVVGPGDPATVEAGIKERFGSWRGRGPAGKDPPPVAPARTERTALHVEADTTPQAALIWTAPADNQADSRSARTARMTEAIALSIAADRLSKMSTVSGNTKVAIGRPDMPDGSTPTQIAIGQPVDMDAAVASLATAQRQILERPVTQTELDLAVTRNRDAIKQGIASPLANGTRVVIAGLLESIARDKVFTAEAERLTLFEEAAAATTPGKIDLAFKDLFPGTPLLFVASRTEPKGGEAGLRTALNRARQGALPALTQAELKTWPFTDFGSPGGVVDRKEDPLGVTMVKFANNVRLTVKPSSLREDQILVRVLFGQGTLEYPKDRPTAARLWTSGFLPGGLQGLTNRERQMALEGRDVSIAALDSDGGFTLAGTTKKADLDLQMQLLAAFMTKPAWSPDDFEGVKARYLQAYATRDATPGSAYAFAGAPLLYGGDARFAPLTEEVVRRASMRDIRAFFEPILAQSDIEILMVGTLTVDQAIEAVAKTFGALPDRKPLKETPGARQVRFPAPTATPVKLTHKGRPDLAMAVVSWPTSDYYSEPAALYAAQTLHAIYAERMLERVRMAQGKTYNIAGGVDFSRVFTGYGQFIISAEVPPAAVDDFYASASAIAEDLRTKGVTQAEVDKHVRAQRQQMLLTTRADAYWASTLVGAQREPRRLETARNPLAMIERITVEEVNASARRWLAPEKTYRISVLPDGVARPGAPGTVPVGQAIRISQPAGR